MSNLDPGHNISPDHLPPTLQFTDIERGQVDLEALTPLEQAGAKVALFVTEVLDTYQEDDSTGMVVNLKRTGHPDVLKPDSITVEEQELSGMSTTSYSVRLEFPLSVIEMSTELQYEVMPSLEGEEPVTVVTEIDLSDQSFGSSLDQIDDPLEREKYIAAFNNGMDSLKTLLNEGYEPIPEVH